MKMRLHDVLDQLPVSFQKRYEEKKSCWCIEAEAVNYDLTVEVWESSRGNWSRYRYFRIYYSPRYYWTFSKNPPVIWDKYAKRIEEDNFEENLKNLKRCFIT